MRKNIRELIEQPYAMDSLESMGLLKAPADFTDAELKMLEPFWEKVDATATSLNLVTKSDYSRTWWKEAVMYQIYPMSFCDSNGDGIGDINGIISKLDYLKNLGVDVVWLSPIYDSPNDDNGYDIRNYQAINSDYGTMEDFDRLLSETHKRGMKLIMDMMLNHSSDEHEWFKKALAEPDSKYKDYYIWKKGNDEATPPNNWESVFSGSAWNYYPEVGEWALHLFSKKQMDLNWDNPELRNEIFKMLNWWMDKGLDGFRLDVINLISKYDGLPDGDGNGFVTGFEQYSYGPKLHNYIKEMNREVFSKYPDCFTVGEVVGLGRRTLATLTRESRKEINAAFNFTHLNEPGKNKYSDYAYDLNYLKKCTNDIQNYVDYDDWMTTVFDNHDNPRFISRISKDESKRTYLANLIALLQMSIRGTAFIYEGEELGMAQAEFKDASEFRDVEAINRYKLMIESGKSEDEAFKFVSHGTRDQSRTPMPWNSEKNGGFTDGTPWIAMNSSYPTINAAAEMDDENSVLNFYKKAIALRKKYKTLIYGKYESVRPEVHDFFGFTREDKDGRFYVEINLSAEETVKPIIIKGERLLGNYDDIKNEKLRPYEINLIKVG